MKNINLRKPVTSFLIGIAFMILSTAAFAAKITVKGSDTMIILAQRWAEIYMNENPETSIQVTGGGSGTGIAALINGTTDIANASREIKPKEIVDAQNQTGKMPYLFQVAMDALSVVVHKDNPISELTLKQIEGIYVGAINNWNELGGPDAQIIRYCRESNSGTYVFFKEHVLQNSDYAPDCQNMPGTSAVADAISQDPHGIGYGGVAYFMTRPETKIIAIKKDDSTEAILPVKAGKINFDVVYSGAYPIARYLNSYTLGEPGGDLRKYIEWMLSPEGQRIAEETGYIPIPTT